MDLSPASEERCERLLKRLRAGDERARDELLEYSYERLRHLARRMKKRFRVPIPDRLGQTDDVLQNAAYRLHRCLEQVSPESPEHFFRLAATQIKRELIDMVRQYYGPLGRASNVQTNAGDGEDDARPYELPVGDDAPPALLEWSEFQSRVAQLPEEEGEVFQLRWFCGMTIGEAARCLGVSESTVDRRWLAARMALSRSLDGDAPPVG